MFDLKYVIKQIHKYWVELDTFCKELLNILPYLLEFIWLLLEKWDINWQYKETIKHRNLMLNLFNMNKNQQTN